MRKNWKKILLCLLAVSSVTVSGRTFAADDEGEVSVEVGEADTEEAPEKAKRAETVEKAELSEEDAEKYLEKIGSADGYEVYRKDKDFDDVLWESVGGKPKSKKDYTDEQKLLADKIDELKKLGELVIIDSKNGHAAASFKSGS